MMIPSGKNMYLCTPDNKIVAVLNGVNLSTVDFHPQIKGYSELSFTVDKYIIIDGKQVESNGYEDLKVYMNIYLEDIGYFQIQDPTVMIDGNQEVKEVVAYSVEKEFESKDWKGLKINCGASDSVEYLYEDNINGFGFANRYVIMYDPYDPRFSFLHMIVDRMGSMWAVGYVDYKIAGAQIPNLEIDNENLYAVMTSEVAPRLSCLFVFDYLNYTINVYHKDSLDFDTGIFIGFRNLANQVEVSIDQDSIFTRFSVQGEDNLNINYYTYGTGQIINLDYFLGEPYMDETLANKYRQWQALRNDYIDEYIALAKDMVALNQKIHEFKYAVPNDEFYWKNWDGMNREGLEENKKIFNSKLQLFQVAVDPRPIEDKYYNYGTQNQQYAPKLNNKGEVDHEWYLNLLEEKVGEVDGYHTYYEIVTYVLPYIDLALENLTNGTSVKPEDRNIGVLTDNWDLYGYEELDGVRKSYEEDLMGTLSKYSKNWGDMTEEERAQKNLNYADGEAGYEASAGRKEYKHIVECLGNRDNPAPGTIYYRLAQLEAELEELEDQMSEYSSTLAEYNNIMNYAITDIETYKDADGNYVEYEHLPQALMTARENCLFTEEEVSLISTLIHDTDYVNSNIFSTSIDDLNTIFAKEHDLLVDAENKLFEVSQPQYTFSISMDNMLRLSEYEGWYNQGNMLYPNNNDPDAYSNFGLLRYIYVGIRDDYQIKLRVIGYRWNPCDVTPDLTIEFSNMITSKSGRSDLVQLLELENNAGAKNSISIGSGVNRADSEVIASLVNMISSNSIFKSSVMNIAGGVIGPVDTAAIQDIINEYGGSLNVNVGNLVGNAAQYGAIFTTYLSSDIVQAKIINASQGKFEELTAKIIRVGTDGITEITNNCITTATIKASQIDAKEGSFQKLAADILDAGTITVDMITGTSGSFNTFFVSHLDVDEVFGNNANFQNIVSDTITSNHIATKLAQINQADINVLFAENAFVQSLRAVSTSVVTSETMSAYIQDLVASNISVADLLAGNIVLSDTMTITSENGHLLMDGTTIQIFGEDKNGNIDTLPGIQLGYDTNNKPSLIVRNSSGATILDASGITQNAVADDLIKTRMIDDYAVTKQKVSFNVATANADGTVNIETIKEGGGQFSYNYTQFKNNTTSSINVISGQNGSNLIRNSKTLIDSKITFE